MTQGFYEQLGVSPNADHVRLRASYTAAVAELARRRSATLEQGGDTSRLDLARQQVDEAWHVLSDPARRRRYDTMLAMVREGWTDEPDEIWRRASGALIHPAAAAAADLLRVATNLSIGTLPPAPGPRRTPVTTGPDPDMEKTVTATDPLPQREDVSSPVVALPTAATNAPNPSLRVVDGSPESSDVLIMPKESGRDEFSENDLDVLIDQHGYSGALLRAVRVVRNVDLQEMADTTRISARYLDAVESEDFEGLPSATFVRGYVREMARFLDLDEDFVVPGYMERFRS
jgi:hypothetical protein